MQVELLQKDPAYYDYSFLTKPFNYMQGYLDSKYSILRKIPVTCQHFKMIWSKVYTGSKIKTRIAASLPNRAPLGGFCVLIKNLRELNMMGSRKVLYKMV